MEVLGEHGRGEALGHAVVVGDRLFESLELEYVDDGCEDFLIDNLSVSADRNDRWLDVVSGACNLLASAKDTAALSHNLLETLSVLMNAVGGVHGAHQGASSHGVANGHSSVSLDHTGNEGVVDGLVEVDSSQRGASLAASANCGEDSSLEG